MKKIIFILGLLLIASSMSLHATVIYVDSTHVTGVKNGASWATAFSNFQTAIDSAHTGDSIWVAKGTYKPTFSGSAFAMKDSVKIFGGFLNTHTNFHDRNWAQNATVLKGDAYMVILNSLFNTLTPEAWLDGFTITGGTKGGMENSFSSPTINNCTFIKNNSTSDGAAMQNNACSSIITNCKFISNQGGSAVVNAGFGAFPPDNEAGATFVNCIFSDNSGTDAGGVMNSGCIVNFTDCDFINNKCTVNGGAMFNTEAVVNITDCRFVNNNATEKGGGIYQQNCISTITACSFTSNKAQYGGGIGNQSDTSIRYMNLSNCSFDANQAIIAGTGSKDQLYGGGVYNRGKSNVSYCIFRNNTAGHNSSGAAGGGLYNWANSVNVISNINNCRFYNNKAYVGALTWWASGAAGGGASVSYANVTDCIFEGNEATIHGGGLYISASTTQDGKVNRCQFIGNKSGKGGGISGSAAIKIYNSLLAKNTADTFGGGLYMARYQGYTTGFSNNTITGNTALAGGGVYFYAYTAITSSYPMSNSIVWGNNTGIDKLASLPAPTITYSLIQGMAADPGNHILNGTTNPLFVDAAAGNYQLLATSPGIDVGRNDSLPSAFNTDLANHSRIYNTTIDLGAYEYGIFSPEASLGNDTTVCSNTVLPLRLPYQAATSFLWSTGANTSSINVSTPGKYYVTVSNIQGTASDTIVVNHHGLPVVNLGNDTSFCGNGLVSLDAKNPGATYLWNNSATSQIIQAGNGTFSVVVTDSNLCRSTDTVNITHFVVPFVKLGNDVAIIEGKDVTLDAGNPGATYLWSNGATTQTIKVSIGGTYSVKVTNSQGCSNTDDIIVTVFPVEIDEINTDNNTLSLYPNPALDQVTIQVHDVKLLQSKLILCDVYGHPVRTVVIEKREQSLSLEGLAPGIYFIKTENNRVWRLVKQ